VPRPPRSKCPILDGPCPEHLTHHGKEAEELRAGIEGIIEDHKPSVHDVVETHAEAAWRDEIHAMRKELQELLDKVDARDSLAFTEYEVKTKGPVKAAEGMRARKLGEVVQLFDGATKVRKRKKAGQRRTRR